MTDTVLRGTVKAIPTPTRENQLDVLKALVEFFNTREGRSRNKGIRFVTANEIEAAGLPVPVPGGGSGGGSGVGVTSVSGVSPIQSSGGTTPAISLADDGVTYAKMQQISTAYRLLGNANAYPSNPQELEAVPEPMMAGFLAYAAHRG